MQSYVAPAVGASRGVRKRGLSKGTGACVRGGVKSWVAMARTRRKGGRGGRFWRAFLATFARHWYTGKRVLDAILVPRGVFFATSKMRRNGVALRNMEHPRVRAVRFLGHVSATFWDAGRGATRSRNAKLSVAEVSCDVFFATSKKRRHGVALRNMSHPRMGVKNTRRCCFGRSTRNHKKSRL